MHFALGAAGVGAAMYKKNRNGGGDGGDCRVRSRVHKQALAPSGVVAASLVHTMVENGVLVRSGFYFLSSLRSFVTSTLGSLVRWCAVTGKRHTLGRGPRRVRPTVAEAVVWPLDDRDSSRPAKPGDASDAGDTRPTRAERTKLRQTEPAMDERLVTK